MESLTDIFLLFYTSSIPLLKRHVAQGTFFRKKINNRKTFKYACYFKVYVGKYVHNTSMRGATRDGPTET